MLKSVLFAVRVARAVFLFQRKRDYQRKTKAMRISTDDLQKARRNAKRSRAFAACVPCKSARAQCSDYRPCKRCSNSGKGGYCVDQNETNHKKAYRFAATSEMPSPNSDQIITSSISAFLPVSDWAGCAQIPSVQTVHPETKTVPTSRVAVFDGSSQWSVTISNNVSQQRASAPQCSTFSARPISAVQQRCRMLHTAIAFQSVRPSAPSSLFHAAAGTMAGNGTINGISNPGHIILQNSINSNLSMQESSRFPQSIFNRAAISAMTPASGAGFSAAEHHQAAALPCNPVSAHPLPRFQPPRFTSGSAGLSALPSQYPSISGLAAALASPPSSLVANPDRIFQPPPSMPVVSPAALLAAPSAAQRTLPGPADLYAVDRLRLLLALAASGSGPAHATARHSTPWN